MTIIYIMRHGETVWNTEKRMQGWKDSPLTELGKMQARAVGERLKDVKLDAIFASSAGRTLATAEQVRGGRNIPLIPRDDLREINLGGWEGRLHADIDIEEPVQSKLFFEDPGAYAPSSGGETFAELTKRVLGAIDDIAARYPDGTVLIVTHAAALKSAMTYFTGRPLKQLWDEPYAHQASLSAVKLENGKAEVLMYGDTQHLNGLMGRGH
jgi:probable phosphoglycerate mutase